MCLVDYIGFGKNTNRVDNSYLILNDYFELPIHQEGEVVVEYKYCVQTVRAIRDLVVKDKHPVNYITEVNNHISVNDFYLLFIVFFCYQHLAGWCWHILR